mgnify:CR=1 FL=1
MILIDSRIGSKDLIDFIPQSKLTFLEYGDAAFTGKGENYLPVQIGIEIKTVGDALDSLTSGRFAGHQLPGMLVEYQQVYLIIQGQYRLDPKTGVMQVPRRRRWIDIEIGPRKYMYRDFHCWLMTFVNCCQVKLEKSSNRRETAQIIKDIYRWWNSKEYNEHRSHLVQRKIDHGAMLIKPSLKRRWANELTGIGWEKSQKVASHFKSALELANASKEDWIKIEGIGTKIAEQSVEEIRR